MAEQRLNALAADLAAARRELRNAQSQKRRRMAGAGLTPYQCDVALRAFALSGYNLAVAGAVAQYVASARAGRRMPVPEIRDLEQKVTDLFMVTDVNELAEKGRWGAMPGCAAARTAERLVQECMLSRWARRVNVERGVAPGTRAVIRAKGEGKGAPLRVQAVGEPCSKAQRMWAMRWRRRWGGRVGKLRVREPLAQEEAKRKALSGMNVLGGQVLVTIKRGRLAAAFLVPRV